MAKFTLILLTICTGSTTQETLMKCQSGGRTYTFGQTYVEGSCDLCTCELTGPKCHRGVLCTLGKREDRAVETQTCVQNGVTYHVGDTFSDGCNTCMCDKWGALCTAMYCGQQLGKRGTTCEYAGVSHALGDTFSTGCHYCVCEDTGPRCIALPCKKRQSSKRTTCEYAGVSHALGDTFSTGCHYCVCEDTGPRCIALPCKKRQSSKPTCKHDGKIYSDGEHYVRFCQECTCTEGQWKCGSYWMCELGR